MFKSQSGYSSKDSRLLTALQLLTLQLSNRLLFSLTDKQCLRIPETGLERLCCSCNVVWFWSLCQQNCVFDCRLKITSVTPTIPLLPIQRATYTWSHPLPALFLTFSYLHFLLPSKALSTANWRKWDRLLEKVVYHILRLPVSWRNNFLATSLVSWVLTFEQWQPQPCFLATMR